MWIKPPQQLILEPDCVHIWQIDVLNNESHLAYFKSLLSTDEIERTARFKFQKSRLIYCVGKGVLRYLLSRYLKCEATKIGFHYNKQGKPFIDSSINLKFNLSNSGDKILIGVTLNHEIGIDIEFNKRFVEIPRIVKRFFAKQEINTLLQLPKDQWQTAFFNCWTRKEAFIKAKGGGFSIPLDQFEVTLRPEDKAELQIIQWDQNDVPNWNLKAFNCGEDYTCAAIVNHPNLDYYFFDWNTKTMLI